MADEPGFLIEGELYPITEDFTIGDSVLVKMIAGLDMEDFAEGLIEGQMWVDPRILAATVGTAVWRKHPRWSIDRVTRFVHQLDMTKLGIQEGTPEAEEEPEDDAGPPSLTKTEPESPTTSDVVASLPERSSSSPVVESNGSGDDTGAKADSESGESPPIPSGSPVSPITSAASALGS